MELINHIIAMLTVAALYAIIRYAFKIKQHADSLKSKIDNK